MPFQRNEEGGWRSARGLLHGPVLYSGAPDLHPLTPSSCSFLTRGRGIRSPLYLPNSSNKPPDVVGHEGHSIVRSIRDLRRNPLIVTPLDMSHI